MYLRRGELNSMTKFFVLDFKKKVGWDVEHPSPILISVFMKIIFLGRGGVTFSLERVVIKTFPKIVINFPR